MFEKELREAITAKVHAVERKTKTGAPYLSVWSDQVRVNFVPLKGGNVHVHVHSHNIDEKAIKYRKEVSMGSHPRHKAGKFIRILGACSPRYVSYALRHAGIMEHEECDSCKAHHAPAANHTFWR